MLRRGIYKHYKGTYYQVLYVATHTETQEQYVVYTPVGGTEIWVRPLSMFMENVTVGGMSVPRFMLEES